MTYRDPSRPPFRADHVGSLLRPRELHAARTRAAAGGMTQAELAGIEDRCIRDVVQKQEAVGLSAVTDGEIWGGG